MSKTYTGLSIEPKVNLDIECLLSIVLLLLHQTRAGDQGEFFPGLKKLQNDLICQELFLVSGAKHAVWLPSFLAALLMH